MTPLAATAAAFLIGAYVGNPNGNDQSAEASFEQQYNSFVAGMGGLHPQTMNAFVDFTQNPSAWPGNAAWTAWSWTQSPVVGTATTPVIGIPMADNAHWYGGAGGPSDQFFQAIAAGTYDADYKGVVDSWANAGFKIMYLRLGYEMDGGFMPWFMGNDTATQGDWVVAFQHLATLMRAEAKADGATAGIVWNPADIQWTQLPVRNAYPGDAYVDVISADAYSPLYPGGYYDWVLNNGTYAANIQQWWQTPGNQQHFWTWPNANQWNPHGTPGCGWGMDDTIALALSHHKALGISETGAGGDGTTTGPLDEPAFPRWLALKLTQALAAGVQPAYVNIWDAWESDGDWDFSSANAGKPHEAKSWAQWFGAKSALGSAAAARGR